MNGVVHGLGGGGDTKLNCLNLIPPPSMKFLATPLEIE